MITKIKNVYYCEYCKHKTFQHKRMIRHEMFCCSKAEFKNYKYKCYDCDHFYTNRFECKAYNKKLYSLQQANHGNFFINDKMLMPMECERFVSRQENEVSVWDEIGNTLNIIGGRMPTIENNNPIAQI